MFINNFVALQHLENRGNATSFLYRQRLTDVYNYGSVGCSEARQRTNQCGTTANMLEANTKHASHITCQNSFKVMTPDRYTIRRT